MRPDIKYGLIGGIVFTIILIVANYFLELTATNYTASVYLKELVLIVSVVAAVKGIRDSNTSAPIELKTGMRAGLSASLIICGFVFVFGMSYPYTISKSQFISVNEIGFKEYLKRAPVTDSSDAAFLKKTNSYDSSMKANDIFAAYFFLRRAKAIRPADTSLDPKLNDLNDKLFAVSRQPLFLMKNVFVSNVFPQLVMGFLVSFVTTMLFRFRQQNEM